MWHITQYLQFLPELVSLTLVYSPLFFSTFSPFLFGDNNNFNLHMRGSPENGSKMLLELFYHLNNPILGQHKFGLYFSFVYFFSFYIIFENGKKPIISST